MGAQGIQNRCGQGCCWSVRADAWFARSRHWGLERPAVSHGQQFTVSHLGNKLTVHFLLDPDDACVGYLLLKAEPLGVSAAHLANLPLSEREREILALVAAGKTNGEIATVLAISARTVQKHLQHIFQKLGVETRTAAAIRALEAVDDLAGVSGCSYADIP
jgi:DNA-binding CsgD family transcriptional regulator